VKRRNNKGFTLIELMIVVVIIGILAALAIPRFMPASSRAKQREALSILKQIYVMQRVYFQETGAYTTDLADLGIVIQANARYDYTILAPGASFVATANAPDPGVDDDPAPDTWRIDDQGLLIAVSDDVTS
jgi:prepilin-type N-terminal cleavage/methylation domain-containing protein